MPEELKGSNAVVAYRKFYHKDKATFASWKYRDKPIGGVKTKQTINNEYLGKSKEPTWTLQYQLY